MYHKSPIDFLANKRNFLLNAFLSFLYKTEASTFAGDSRLGLINIDITLTKIA